MFERFLNLQITTTTRQKILRDKTKEHVKCFVILVIDIIHKYIISRNRFPVRNFKTRDNDKLFILCMMSCC